MKYLILWFNKFDFLWRSKTTLLNATVKIKLFHQKHFPTLKLKP